MIKNINELNTQTLIKYALATVIITMGAYGYYQFFFSEESSFAIWLVLALFVVIEIAILSMTSERFSNTLQQEKGVGRGLIAALVLMCLISGVGIDQTIWSMVENKYHKVQSDEAAVKADKETELLLQGTIAQLTQEQISLTTALEQTQQRKMKAKKAYDKTARKLTDTIYYNGRRCDLSADCTARKEVAQNALELAKDELDSITLSLQSLKQTVMSKDTEVAKAKEKIEAIVANRVAFEKRSRLVLENKEEEGLLHVGLMNLLNSVFNMKIETPERAYVMVLSFIVYPIYILFIAFISSNTSEMQAKRRERLRLKTEPDNITKAILFVGNQLRKVIAYFIKTRVRKVIEIEKEVEVIKEVEKPVYKDGKEIVKVEIEVPHIIEKEVIVEKTVEKPVVEKEFVVLPAGIDLNELNKIAGSGVAPQELMEILKAMSDKNTNVKGMHFDQHRAA